MASVSYDSEQRLAVVMYGGVSLAIYIGGIARELLGAVRATAPRRDDPGTAGLDDGELTAVERIYRRAARLRDGITGEQSEDEAVPIRTRVSIDILSGTSAGGINGIFLAKALANDSDLDAILRLWIDEGDLSKLLNDHESVGDLDDLPVQNPPAALLNGERMFKKLLAAFQTMDRGASSKPKRYDPGRVDLFVTTTDIRGELVNLQVLNTTAQEKRYRQRFHFTYEDGRETEFAEAENATLAFAARCTSSFPFAFEPFTWNDASRLAGAAANGAKWQDRLMYTNDNYASRPMGDGGYLDNKPFSYAIDELSRRQSAFKVRRYLLYVEPDPQHFNENRMTSDQTVKPDAIENALAALVTIPGYETIREDLQRVVEQNERVHYFREAEEETEKALETWLASRTNPTGADWLKCSLDELLALYGPGYGAYHGLKVSVLIDTIADLICSAGGVARPEISQVVRDLVRQWTRTTYATFEEQKRLLVQADIDYRLRRLSFVLRKAEDLKSDAAARTRSVLKTAYDGYYTERRKLRRTLQEWIGSLPTLQSDGEALVKIAKMPRAERRQAIIALAASLSGEGAQLQAILAKFEKNLRAVSATVSKALEDPDPDVVKLRTYYDQFQSYDVVLYPMARNSGIDEGVPVEIVRVSPRDVRAAHRLRGMALGHFGAFLEEDWRRNDILWGRLDAAETILRLLVPNGTDAEPIIAEAHRAIVAEQLGADLRKRLIDATAVRSGAPVPGDAQQRQRQCTIDAAKSCLDDPALLHDLFTGGGGYDGALDRQKQIVSAGRAGVIVEKIVRGTAVKSSFPWPGAARLVATALAAVAQIAVPRSVVRTVSLYWVRLLTLVFIGLVVAGMILGTPIVTWTGVKGLIVISAGALAVFFVERWTQRRLPRAIIMLVLWTAFIAAGLWVIHLQFAIPLPRIAWREIPWITKADAVFMGVAIVAAVIAGVVIAARWIVKLVNRVRAPKTTP